MSVVFGNSRHMHIHSFMDIVVYRFRGYRTTMHSITGQNHAVNRHGSTRVSRWDNRSRGAGVTVHISLPGSSRGVAGGVSAGGRHKRAGRSRGAEFGRNIRRSGKCAPASYRR